MHTGVRETCAAAFGAGVTRSLLTGLEMGFLPVPGLSPREPSTTFKVRGRSLRVDLLTPAARSSRAPVFIERFGAAAQPLPYLDDLLENAQPAAVVDGGGVLVRVPHPARFALHKLLVAASRAVAFRAKSGKDLRQAAQLVEHLEQDRPGDIALAWAALAKRGPRWTNTAQRSIARLTRRSPAAAALLRSAVRARR